MCHLEPREGAQLLSVTKLALKPVPRLSLCVHCACHRPAPVRRGVTHTRPRVSGLSRATPNPQAARDGGPGSQPAEVFWILMCMLRFGKVGNQFALGRKSLDWGPDVFGARIRPPHVQRDGHTSIHPEQMERKSPTPCPQRQAGERPVLLPDRCCSPGTTRDLAPHFRNGLHLSGGTGLTALRGEPCHLGQRVRKGGSAAEDPRQEVSVTGHVKDVIILGTVPLPLDPGAPGPERWQQGLRGLLHTGFPAGAELCARGEGLGGAPHHYPHLHHKGLTFGHVYELAACQACSNHFIHVNSFNPYLTGYPSTHSRTTDRAAEVREPGSRVQSDRV